MQAVHELGHTLAALASGGHVTCVVWHIAAISRTDVLPNPHPLFVCWAGPVVGSLFPYIAAAIATKISPASTLESTARRPTQFESDASSLVVPSMAGQLSFYAGFCLVANGVYISVGSIDHAGDAGELQQLGSPVWLLWFLGAVGVLTGFRVWHRLGPLREFSKVHATLSTLLLQVAVLLVALVLQFVLVGYL